MVSAQRLSMVYICTKFSENILVGFRVLERTQFLYYLFQRGIIPFIFIWSYSS